jgi:hypothetical protein
MLTDGTALIDKGAVVTRVVGVLVAPALVEVDGKG